MEKRLLIADAGPLIALAKVSRLQLLAELFPEVAITDSVRIECLSKDTADARIIQQALSDNQIVCIPDPVPAHHLMQGLGQGELSCIQFALQDPNSKLLLLDDALARREAYRKGVRFIGTAMLLYLAEKEGLLDSAEEVAEQMSAHGYRISVQILVISYVPQLNKNHSQIHHFTTKHTKLTKLNRLFFVSFVCFVVD